MRGCAWIGAPERLNLLFEPGNFAVELGNRTAEDSRIVGVQADGIGFARATFVSGTADSENARRNNRQALTWGISSGVFDPSMTLTGAAVAFARDECVGVSLLRTCGKNQECAPDHDK